MGFLVGTLMSPVLLFAVMVVVSLVPELVPSLYSSSALETTFIIIYVAMGIIVTLLYLHSLLLFTIAARR